MKQQLKNYKFISILIFLFLVIGFLIYSNTYNSPFVFDDRPHIEENQHIRITNLSVPSLYNAGIESPDKKRPITYITLALNYYFNQYSLPGYHFVNICIHIINGILLFFLFRHTLRLSPSDSGKTKKSLFRYDFIAAAAALLWVASPVQTQAVTYIIQRMTSLASFFYFFSILMYINGRLSKSKKAAFLFFVASFLSGLLAIGTKEIAVTLPFFIVIYEFYFFRDLKFIFSKKEIALCLTGLSIAIYIALFFIGFEPIDRILIGYTWRDFTLPQRLLTETRVIVYYLSLIFFPHPSRLNLEHDFPLSYSLFNPHTTLLSILFILLLAGVCIRYAKKYRILSFAILWFLGNLFIESTFLALEIIFEHRIYLPSAFIFLTVVSFIGKKLPTKLYYYMFFFLISVSSLWTYDRNNTWQNTLTLWADCVSKSPDKVRPLHAYGYALMQNRQFSEATIFLEKVLKIKPDHIASNINMGEIRFKQGNYYDSIRFFGKAASLQPDNARSYAFLGLSYELNNDPENAESFYCRALEIDPDFSGAYSKLGALWQKEGKWTKAYAYFKTAIEINPYNSEIFFRLGEIYEHMEQPAKAAQRYLKSISLNSEHSKAHLNLSKILYNQDKLDEAVFHLSEVCRIDPKNGVAQSNLGTIMLNSGNYSAAMKPLEKAAAISPASLDANIKAGVVFVKNNRPSDALYFLKKAVSLAPENVLIHNTIGGVYQKLNDTDSAIRHFEIALRLDPSLMKNHRMLGELYHQKGKLHLSNFHYDKFNTFIKREPGLSN